MLQGCELVSAEALTSCTLSELTTYARTRCHATESDRNGANTLSDRVCASTPCGTLKVNASATKRPLRSRAIKVVPHANACRRITPFVKPQANQTTSARSEHSIISHGSFSVCLDLRLKGILLTVFDLVF